MKRTEYVKTNSRRAQIISIALVFLLPLIAQPVWSADENLLESKALKVGTQAPVFTAKTLRGDDFNLADLLGKKPVIIFFWSFFCGPCREEMPLLHDVVKEMGREKVDLIGVNLDGKGLSKAIEKYMEDSKLNMVIVLDELNGLEYKVADPYGVAGTPTTYIIDLEGIISYASVGMAEPEDIKVAIEQALSGT